MQVSPRVSPCTPGSVNTPTWRLGPTLDVDYTLNEHQLDRFNLQSYRPGVFTDGTIEVGDIKLRPRVAYAFTHDEFNGSTFEWVV